MGRQSIPKALREQVWLKVFGEKYRAKCYVEWCANDMTVFDFEVGHDIPFSCGGTNSLDNLLPICSRCNKSMGDRYSISQWMKQEFQLAQILKKECTNRTRESRRESRTCFERLVSYFKRAYPINNK
jgi:hypothetical protein